MIRSADDLDAAVRDYELAERMRRGAPIDRAFCRRPGSGLGRRSGFRGVGGGGAVLTTLIGVRDFLASTDYYSKTGALFASTPFTCGILLRFNATPASGNNVIFGRWNIASGGGAAFNHAGTSLRFTIMDGTDTAQNSPTITAAAGEAYVLGASYDGSNVRLFEEAGEVSSATAATGYTAPTGLDDTVGVRHAKSSDADTVTVMGVVVGSSILTAAQWTTWIQSVKAAYRVVDLPAGMVAGWDCRAAGMTPSAAPASWAPFTGSGTFSETGSLTVEEITPTYGN